MAQASTLSIQEISTSGVPNRLDLQGRALPYRPVSFEGEMRAQITWYPGNPIATLQMLGSKENTTRMNGMWKDRFLRLLPYDPRFDAPTPLNLAAAAQAPVPQEAIALFNAVQVADVMDLVRVVDGFRRRGILLEVTWDEITRFGILQRFRQTWYRREDCEWEMEFLWISQGEPPQPVMYSVQVPAVDVFGLVANVVNTLKTLANAPFQLVNTVVTAISTALDLVNGAVTAIGSIASNYQAVNTLFQQDPSVTAATSPSDAARALAGNLLTIQTQAFAIKTAVESLPSREMFSGVPAGNVTEEQAILAGIWGRQLRKQAFLVATTAAGLYQEQLAKTVQRDLKATFIARNGMDLRDVAARYYGSPNGWKQIASFNHFSSSKLTAGTLVMVPKVGTVQR